MELLSLHEAPPVPAPRLTRTEAVVASVAFHLTLLLLFLYVPERLPDSLRRWLEPLPRPNTPVAERATPLPALAVQPTAAPKVQPTPPIPVEFAYVRIPKDVTSEKNPAARLLSDKDRQARQEAPTPADVRKFSTDPHAEGNSRDRVKPDPSLREGPDPIEPDETGAQTTARTREVADGRATADASKAAKAGDTAGQTPREPLADSGTPVPPTGGSAAPAGAGAHDKDDESAREPFGKPTPNSTGGTEYKFSFNSQGWLRGGGHGTLSFDTQGFPWGDYARKLYAAVRNNWLERIPLAAREGISGYTCQHFLIARDGTITEIDVVRTSSVPPFNKAAADAIRASSQLPPLPEDFPHEREGVTFCFYYNMYPGEVE